MTDELDEIVHEFLAESRENLDQLDRDLVLLERQPDSAELLQSIFRTVHTIKGTSGFLAYAQLEALTHAGEGLLGRLRDGDLVLTGDHTSALLELVDGVREILDSIETFGVEDGRERVSLIEWLTALQESSGPPPVVDPSLITDLEPPRLGEILVDVAGVAEDDVTMAVLEQRLGDERPIGQILVDRGLASEDQVEAALAAQAEGRGGIHEGSIRVDVGLLDTLMRLVGELVLTRNQIAASTATAMHHGDATMERSSQQLNQLVGELQAGVMKTRMQQIDTVWNRLPRLVRDLGVSCGRKVRLVLEGRDIELDRAILEAIKDPLTHIVRNSVDHGIEPPEARIAAGKPEEGCLTLRAFHEGGQVNIEISDDGAGIDEAAVAAKAIRRRLITPDQAASMTTRELINLIFVPGFSTAETVTNVSGRGVGMDVVRNNIEKIGGTVDVSSEIGHGTTLRLRIPLTLAIVPALTVECHGQRYAVPQVGVQELVCLDGDSSADSDGVENCAGAPVFRLRGRLLPLVRLDGLLEVGTDSAERREPAYMLVLEVEGRRFGLLVDAVLAAEEIVVKPLSAQLQRIGAYAGATILGDGRVGLILDIRALARRAGLVGDGDAGRDTGGPVASETVVPTTEPLLVVAVGEHRVAMPLSRVTRLEEIRLAGVEAAGGTEVVQYRGDLMRLARLSSLLGATRAPTAGEDRDAFVNVVVCTEAGRPIGLVVDAVLDIAHEDAGSRRPSVEPGLTALAVVQGRVTEILDMDQALTAHHPHNLVA